MTQRIIDLFEAVEIQQQQRGRDVALASHLGDLLEAPLQVMAVEQAGEGVMSGLYLQLHIGRGQGIIVGVQGVQFAHGHELA